MKLTENQWEQQIYQFVDQIKDLLSPQIWENILFDCSKNELFTLWLLYRRGESTMTQVADYLHVPLNTDTGIIARMEKRRLVIRERSAEDKRVVTIRMGDLGEDQIQAILKEFLHYSGKVLKAFSPEEMDLLLRMMNQVLDILQEEQGAGAKKKKVKKIEIQ